MKVLWSKMVKRKPAQPKPSYRQHRSLSFGRSTDDKQQRPSKLPVSTKHGLIFSKVEVGILFLVFIFFGLQFLDVGERPHIRLQPTSPFVGLAEVSQLEIEVHELVNSTKFSSLQPFIPRHAIEELLESKPYITSSSIDINVWESRLEIVVVPEGPFAVLTTASEQQFVLTTAGYVLRDFDVSDVPRDIITLHDPLNITANSIRANEPILSKEGVDFMIDLGYFFGIPDPRQENHMCFDLPGLPQLDLERVELTNNPHQLDIYLSGSNFAETKIIMSTRESAIEQGIALARALSFFTDGDEALPSEYIDVRLVDKVIYD